MKQQIKHETTQKVSYLHKGIFSPHATFYPSHTLSILAQHLPCVIH